jgi:hypothetical protein
MNGKAMSRRLRRLHRRPHRRCRDARPDLLGSITAVATGGDFGEKTPREQLAYLAKLLGGEFATPNRLVELSRGLRSMRRRR